MLSKNFASDESSYCNGSILIIDGGTSRTNTIVKDIELHKVNTTNKVREEFRHETVNRFAQGETRHVLERREVRGVNCNCGPEGGRGYGVMQSIGKAIATANMKFPIKTETDAEGDGQQAANGTAAGERKRAVVSGESSHRKGRGLLRRLFNY